MRMIILLQPRMLKSSHSLRLCRLLTPFQPFVILRPPRGRYILQQQAILFYYTQNIPTMSFLVFLINTKSWSTISPKSLQQDLELDGHGTISSIIFLLKKAPFLFMEMWFNFIRILYPRILWQNQVVLKPTLSPKKRRVPS